MNNQPLGSRQVKMLQRMIKAINRVAYNSRTNSLDHNHGSIYITTMGDAKVADSLKKRGLIVATQPHPQSYIYISLTDEALTAMGTSWQQLGIDYYTRQIESEFYLRGREDETKRRSFEWICRSDYIEFLTNLYGRNIDAHEAWSIDGERIFQNSLNYETAIQDFEHKQARIELLVDSSTNSSQEQV